MKVRLIRDVSWTTATKVVVQLDQFGLDAADRVAVFTTIRSIIEDGIKLFDERRRREQSRLCRPEELHPDTLPEDPQ